MRTCGIRYHQTKKVRLLQIRHREASDKLCTKACFDLSNRIRRIKMNLSQNKNAFSRMRTVRSLTVSRGICCASTPPPYHACPPAMHITSPPAMHTPPSHTCPPRHARPLPCTPPAMHAPFPCMPPAMHIPCHACPLPCMPPLPRSMHAPPRGQTDTCKNITFANFVCGR